MKVDRQPIRPAFSPFTLTITIETPEELISLDRVLDGRVLSWYDSDTRVAQAIRISMRKVAQWESVLDPEGLLEGPEV